MGQADSYPDSWGQRWILEGLIMGYYIDQLAEQDRQRRLADLLSSQGEDFTVTQVPQQGNTLADIIRNPNQNWSQETKDALSAYNSRLSNSSISSRGINPNFMAGEPYMPPPQVGEDGLSRMTDRPGEVEQAPMNTIRNNSTGVVTQMPSSGQRSHDVWADGPQEIGRYQLANGTTEIIRKIPVMRDGRQSVGMDRVIETPDYLNPAMLAKQKYEGQAANIAHTKAQTESVGAKPVAVYGADGKTPEFVSPKDAIGRKPYTASIAGQGEFTPEALRTIAEQYLAGDRQAAQGYARNASAKMAIANEINKVAAEKGMSGADIAAVMADYQGMTAGSRVLGGRTANIQLAAGEAAQMIPLALEASKNVARAGFLPFGKAQIMFDDQTNDPALREFAAANNALVNTYARAISPAGVPTVHDKEHARQVLSTAHDQKSYEATVLQMQKEMDAALAAPAKVRGVMRDSISGKSQAQTTSTEKVMTMQDVMDTSKKWNKTTDQVMKDARAAGFTIK